MRAVAERKGSNWNMAGPSQLTRSIIAELEDVSEAIAKDMALRARAKRTVQDLLKALRADNTGAMGRIVARRFEQVLEIYPRLGSTLEKLRLDLGRRQEELVAETCASLEEYCRVESISCKGKAPRFTVDHLLSVELDRVKARTKVGAKSVNSLDWNSVREALEAERARLWQRTFVATTFRDQLFRAYRLAQDEAPSPSGWVPLETIYQILKKETKPTGSDGPLKQRRLIVYYKDEFSADLSRLWEAQSNQEMGPTHFELSAIRDPRRAFSVIQPDGNVGLFGFIRPKESRR